MRKLTVVGVITPGNLEGGEDWEDWSRGPWEVLPYAKEKKPSQVGQ